MDVIYWTSYSGKTKRLTLHVILNAQIEMNTVGSTVSLLFGLYDISKDMWDYLECNVNYDGDVNTGLRPYSAVDLHSFGKDLPDVNGVDSLLIDSKQSWQLD